MRTQSKLILALALLTTPWLARADDAHHPPASQAAGATAKAVEFTEGEVRKLDEAAGKLTLKHEEIKHLDMPGMTMVFTVKDKALLTGLKVGDKVKFKVSNEGGKFTVTELQVQR